MTMTLHSDHIEVNEDDESAQIAEDDYGDFDAQTAEEDVVYWNVDAQTPTWHKYPPKKQQSDKLQFAHLILAEVVPLAKVALFALTVYILVLPLLMELLRLYAWFVKTVTVFFMFFLIVYSGSPTAKVTAVRAAGLVLVCFQLGLNGGGGGALEAVANAIETRPSGVEGRLKVVEKQRMK